MITCYCCSRKATHRIYDDQKAVCTFHRDEALEEETQPILVMRIEEGVTWSTSHKPLTTAI